ncbi:MAG: hypothetical protein QNJ54_02585 [Prochloraceae cyanobacterium]|nr:hypothetical protein [Prochloraceae cyanobacterium]
MIVDLIQDLERYQHVRTELNSYLPSPLDKIRAKAIAQKALREGTSVSSITKKLLEDSDFQKVTSKFGKEQTLKLISDTVKTALKQELNQRKLGLS